MTTMRVTPVAELHIVCDQNAVFPATDFAFYDENDNPVDMTNYTALLEVRAVNGGTVILSWSKAASTITVAGDDNEILRLAEKTAETMAITAKKYIYNYWIYPTGEEPVRFFTGNVIVNPTS